MSTPRRVPDASRNRTLREPHRKRAVAPKARPRRQATSPAWDGEAHTLTWRGTVLKHFRAAAPLQEAILTAFQDAGWPPCIRVESIAVPALQRKLHLRYTISNLNRGLEPWLRFGLEGGGPRIYWRVGDNLTATRREEKD